MAWTIEGALSASTAVTDARKLLNQYEFGLRDLETRVTIRTYAVFGVEGVYWEQSHFIKTPAQRDLYSASRPWGDYEAYALHLAVSSITQYYEEATKKGHAPAESWLVPNPDFKR